VSGYRQFCPIARASEILAERWTFIIVRNLLIGCQTFTEIEKGAPGIPKTLLSTRLRRLESYEIIARRPNPSGRGSIYEMTPMGTELWQIIIPLGSWGMRWLGIGPDIDPGVALWALSKNVDVDRLPKRRVLVRFTFTGRPKFTAWALWDKGELEICLKHPGGDEDLMITAEPEWIGRWHLRRCSWEEAIGGRHIVIEGPRDLARAFPTWFKPDAFSGVEPASQAERRASAG
jgi:DNA-binding HxlR family transcriptional regulator